MQRDGRSVARTLAQAYLERSVQRIVDLRWRDRYLRDPGGRSLTSGNACAHGRGDLRGKQMRISVAGCGCSRTNRTNRNNGRLQTIHTAGLGSGPPAGNRSDLGRTAAPSNCGRRTGTATRNCLRASQSARPVTSRVMRRGSSRVAMPKIAVRNLQRTVTVNVVDLEDFAANAARLCLQIPKNKSTDLTKLREVFVLLISDRRM